MELSRSKGKTSRSKVAARSISRRPVTLQSRVPKLSKTRSAPTPLQSDSVVVERLEEAGDNQLGRLLARRDKSQTEADQPRIDGVVIGTLVGFANSGASPLVIYQEQTGTAAILARSTIALHGQHIGRQLVLMFEDA